MDFVDNRLDPQTGTLRARALIDNPNGLLTPGLFVRVQLKGRGPYPALLIPDEAIGTDQSKRFVMVVDKDGLGAAAVRHDGPALRRACARWRRV